MLYSHTLIDDFQEKWNFMGSLYMFSTLGTTVARKTIKLCIIKITLCFKSSSYLYIYIYIKTILLIIYTVESFKHVNNYHSS